MATDLKAPVEQPQPAAQSEPAPTSSLLRHGLLPALLSSALLWLCFFPVSLAWAAWVAIVPLLCLVRSNLRPRTIYLCAWVSGLLFYWPVLQWMRVADFRMYYTWAMLATYCSVYPPIAVFLIRQIDLRTAVPLTISVPCVWVGLEYMRSFMLTGFAWYYLGHSQHDILPIIQIADFAGVYGVSFLIAAVNAWIFTALYRTCWWRTTMGLRGGHADLRIAEQGFAIFLLLVGTIVYGIQRLGEDDFAVGPRVALLQGNLDQRLRNDAFAKGGESEAIQIHRHYLQLCAVALLKQHERPDLLVWPETSFPLQWIEIHEKLDPGSIPEQAERAVRIQDDIRDMALAFNDKSEGQPTNILLGVNAAFINAEKRVVLYNSALMISPAGNWGPRYDKIHRIPFGEYVPLKDWVPFMKDFMPYDFDYSITPGDKHRRFTLGKHRFGVLICYEDTDPFLGRHYGREEDDGPAVDFLLNISNDGWFDGTAEHEQHLAICRFRAIETRRAVARAVNMGISAVIDPNGRVLKPNNAEELSFNGPANSKVPDKTIHSWLLFDRGSGLGELPVSEWGDYKKTAGVLAANIPIDGRTSYYSLWGDWLPWGCWVVVCGAVVLGCCGRALNVNIAQNVNTCSR